MRGYPQFSFWISIALTQIYFPPGSHKPHKYTSLLVGTVLNFTALPNQQLMRIRKIINQRVEFDEPANCKNFDSATYYSRC